MDRVFILGAGFSRAIHRDMPLLSELGDGVKSALASRGVDIGSELAALDDVERWLTLLGEPAPWLESADQLRNSALFSDVSRAIHEVLTAMQVRASLDSPPPWLGSLVAYWDRMKATVITFNYDCLVELAYEEAMSTHINRGIASRLYGIPVTPALLRTSSMADYEPAESFQFLKLHGSLNWWYSGPEAERSDPIYELRWTGEFSEGIVPLWEDEQKLVEDKLPMLIPPTASKTPFYRNKLLATQWVLAAKALNRADELVLMGYSAPVTDLAVSTLIATQFRGDAIVPVNIDCKAVARARELGSRSGRYTVVDSFIGIDCLDKWVRTFSM